MATADEDDLLRQVQIIQSGADASSVDAAARLLEPLIRDTARRVCRRHSVSKQLAHDFVEDAIASILALRNQRGTARIALYRPAEGPFTGWLWTSLYRLLIDVERRAERRSQLAKRLAEKLAEPFMSAAPYTRSGDENDPFGDHDLRQIESWRLRDRIRLLGAAGLSLKVPRQLWESWCVEADVALPFPAVANDFDDWNDWLAVIAESMQESHAAFRQHWYRKRKLLADLTYVRELRDEG